MIVFDHKYLGARQIPLLHELVRDLTVKVGMLREKAEDFRLKFVGGTFKEHQLDGRILFDVAEEFLDILFSLVIPVSGLDMDEGRG